MLTSEQKAIEAARAADDRKAVDIRIMDMRTTLCITDYFVICSGNSERQVRRIEDAIEERLRDKGFKPARREGLKSGRWILLDYLDFVVHVFMQEDRLFYNLEHLWQDVPFVEWRPDPA